MGVAIAASIALTGCDYIAGVPVDGVQRSFAAAAPMFEALHEAEWCKILKGGCFDAGTKVLMADGTYKPIQDIHVGDWVQSRNEASGQTEARQVTATDCHLTAQTMTLTLTDPKTGEHQVIVCTPNHPFYVQGQGFTPAGSLGIGTSIVTRAGPSLAVSCVRFLPEQAGGTLVYNLTVEGDHTYFVGTVNGGVWVHNKCAGLHHYVPRSLGSSIPYGDQILTYFNAADHTAIHAALDQHLSIITKTLPKGITVDMYPRNGNPGAAVIANFTAQERFNALQSFHQTYQGGAHYNAFMNEFAATVARGRWR